MFNFQTFIPTRTARVFHVVTNLTVLSSITDKIKGISNHFWSRCRKLVNVNDIMLVYDEKVPSHIWRTAMATGCYLVEILK